MGSHSAGEWWLRLSQAQDTRPEAGHARMLTIGLQYQQVS